MATLGECSMATLEECSMATLGECSMVLIFLPLAVSTVQEGISSCTVFLEI